uniref:RNase III domain-containing protein n=1 Tax=Kalanchoe fedtschenkoi TaxID=63787 RepID=A0A7N0RH59_KALFE
MAISATMSALRMRASYDTEQRLPYTPHRTYNKPKTSIEKSGAASSKPSVNLVVSSENFEKVAALLRRSDVKKDVEKEEDTYMGYERWLPSAPKVKKPRSVYNAASLAYIGDSIYELYARRHFLFPPLAIEEFNDRVMAVVRCEAQDVLLQKLLQDDVLTETERDVLRWGKNIGGAKTKTVRRAGAAVYNRASSLETLIGFLYLTNIPRLEEIMTRLGFSTDSSTHALLEDSEHSKKVG